MARWKSCRAHIRSARRCHRSTGRISSRELAIVIKGEKRTRRDFLDNLPAYLDLGTAPEDLLPWLAHWIGLAVDRGDDPVRQRELLRSTSELHGRQGTRLGIELAISAVLGVRTEVVETGGASWSVDPNDPLPGEARPAVVVQVFPVAGQEIDEERLKEAVAALKPAHVIHRVQVVPAD